MKLLLTTLFICACSLFSFGQTDAITDTTIYEVAESLPYPLFKTCFPDKHPGWTADSMRRCGEMNLLGMLSANMRYPAEAQEQGIQGTVVLSFVVEPNNGRISNVGLLKDIGGGCGQEAIRVLKALDEVGMRWAPAMQGGSPIRIRHSIPLRFKLKEALPYFISVNGDTIYTNYDTEPSFKQGIDSLIGYVINRLEYPAGWEDSCMTGVIEMSLLINKKGGLQVEDVLDFNNLGLDFQWEAMRLANNMGGMWQAATYQGMSVTASTPLRVVFKSEASGCKTANDVFDRTTVLSDEGSVLAATNKPDEAISKWTEALKLQPDNCEILYYRGTTLLNQNRREDACKDFTRIKEVLGITWFEDVKRLVCGW